MPDEFKHITVTPEPEEDIVIYAGLGAARGETASAEIQGDPSDGLVSETFDVAPEIRDATLDASPDTSAVSPSESAVLGAEVAADMPAVSPPEKAAPRVETASDAYDDDLTLDDLKSPMPLKQRIIIIAVVICLIGAIVYCLAFMR